MVRLVAAKRSWISGTSSPECRRARCVFVIARGRRGAVWKFDLHLGTSFSLRHFDPLSRNNSIKTRRNSNLVVCIFVHYDRFNLIFFSH